MRYFLWVFIVGFSLTAAECFSLEVTDYRNQKIQLKKPAQRIVALAPHIVENVFSAGAGEQLVAVVSYSNYPLAAKKIPRVGGYHNFSAEQILALQPDLVIMWQSGNGEQSVKQLEALGLTVYVDEPRKLEDIARSIKDISVLAGTQKVGETAVRAYLGKLQSLRKRTALKPPLSVFYQVWNEPLQTLNDEHLVSDVIQLCGGKNVFGDALVIAPKINIESMFERDPKLIVASGMSEERPEWLDDWKKWPALFAVKENNLFFVPPDLIQRHTARILDGAEIFCQHIETARQRLGVDNE